MNGNIETSDKFAQKMVAGLIFSPQDSDSLAANASPHAYVSSVDGQMHFVDALGVDVVISTSEASNGWKPVRLASTANVVGTYSSTTKALTVTATGLLAMDGANVAVGDRLMLKDQTTGAQKGIYDVTVAGGTGIQPVLTRSPDANSAAEMTPGRLVSTGPDGTANPSKTYVLTAVAPVVLDTTSLPFSLLSSSVTFGGVQTALGAATGAVDFNAQALTGTPSVSGAAGVALKSGATTIADAGTTGASDFTLAANKNLKGAAGNGAVDLSLMTGTCKTPSGLNTIGGDLLMAANKIAAFGAPQSLSGPGAVNVTSLATKFTSAGVADALSLANGSQAGQLKIVHHTVDGGSGVLTPTTAGNFATFTFTNVHDACLLMWSGTAWDILLNVGGTVG